MLKISMIAIPDGHSQVTSEDKQKQKTKKLMGSGRYTNQNNK